MPLAEELLIEHTTIVGTICRNKGETPKEMQPGKERPEKSTIFTFSDDVTLTSYVAKKNKAVLVLSTLHHDKATAGDDHKPKIILHDNATKSVVDNMDHLATIFSCKRKTNRWPMVLFYNMIDVAAIAAFVVWMTLHPDWAGNNRKGCRRRFLKLLGNELVEDQIQVRLQNPRALHASVRNALKILNKTVIPLQPVLEAALPSRKHC